MLLQGNTQWLNAAADLFFFFHNMNLQHIIELKLLGCGINAVSQEKSLLQGQQVSAGQGQGNKPEI